MNNQPILCQRTDSSDKTAILLTIGHANYQRTHALTIDNKILNGHIVDAGNPHFVVLDSTTLEWLTQYGRAIESHPNFPDRTNVEFVAKDESLSSEIPTYQMLVFERGCGVTLACGSGAAATLVALHKTGQVDQNLKIRIAMPGGSLLSYIDEDHHIIQIGDAALVFTGNNKITW